MYISFLYISFLYISFLYISFLYIYVAASVPLPSRIRYAFVPTWFNVRESNGLREAWEADVFANIFADKLSPIQNMDIGAFCITIENEQFSQIGRASCRERV